MGVTMITSLTSPAPQALSGITLADDTVTEQSGQAPTSSFSQMLDNRSGSGEEIQTTAFSSESDGLSKGKMEQTSSDQDTQTKLQLPTQLTLARQQIVNLKLQAMEEQTQIAQSATTDPALSTVSDLAKSAGESGVVGTDPISGDETDETSSKETGQKQDVRASVAASPWIQLLVPVNAEPVAVSVFSTVETRQEETTTFKTIGESTRKPSSQPEIAADSSAANVLSDNLQQETATKNAVDNTAATGKTSSNSTTAFNAKSLYAQFSGIDPSLTVEKKVEGIQRKENSVKSDPSESKAKTDATVALTSTVEVDVKTSASTGQQNIKEYRPELSTGEPVTADGKVSNGKLSAKPFEAFTDSVNGQTKISSLQPESVSLSEGVGETASAVQSVGKEASSAIKQKNGKQTENPVENTTGNSSESAKSGAEAGQLRRGLDQTVASETKQTEKVNKDGQNLKPEESKGADVGSQAVISHRQGEMHVNSDNKVTTSSNEAKAPSSEQLHGQIREKLESGDFRADKNSITLKLNPEELGELKINMRMDDQRLKVEVVTENKSVKEALIQNLDSLKETLSRQNISMDQFNVSADIRHGFQQNQRNENRMMQENGKDGSTFQSNRFSEERVQQVLNYGWENDGSLVSLVL